MQYLKEYKQFVYLNLLTSGRYNVKSSCVRTHAYCVIILVVRKYIYETIKMAFSNRPILQNLFG